MVATKWVWSAIVAIKLAPMDVAIHTAIVAVHAAVHDMQLRWWYTPAIMTS